MLRPWEFHITISRDANQTIHQQLFNKLTHVIQSGAFVMGTPLPGTRELASQLGINRKTVIRVYDELIARGWLYTEDKRGTFVRNQAPTHAATFIAQLQTTQHHPVATSAHQGNLLTVKTDIPNTRINLSYPYGDNRIFNMEAMARATRHAIIATKRHHDTNLYSPYGLDVLRQAIAQMLNFEHAMHVLAQHIYITPSAQTALNTVISAIFEKDDYVLLEALHDTSIRTAFHQQHVHTQTVKHHAQGIDLDDLEKQCINYPVRAIYVSPESQQPTTHRMSAENRAKLIVLAKHYNFYIVEDNTRTPFTYAPATAKPIAAKLGQQHVIYLGGLSHLINASYRASYIAPPISLVSRVQQALTDMGDCSHHMSEFTLAELMQSGEAKKQCKRTQKIYQERRDHLCKLIQQMLDNHLSVEKPSAGLCIWVQSKQTISIDAFMHHLNQQQLALHTTTAFHQDKTGKISFAIYFAHLNLEEQSLAVNRLKRVFSMVLQSTLSVAYG
jgi:GntR family transcriptional regulator/MocR family aminotransferase